MSIKHLLVTNDFPPKVGGIQSYLYELWRRLPPETTTVLAAAHPDADSFDRAQPIRIERTEESFLLPLPAIVARVNELALELDVDLVLLDPAWPLGAIGPMLDRPYGVVLHGAEVTIPARLPFLQLPLRTTLRRAVVAVAAGGYPAEEGRRAAGRAIPTVLVPPGVDHQRFRPLGPEERTAARTRLGLAVDAKTVLCVSRLVPRKGIDIAIQAAARLAEDHPDLRLVVAGEGRDRDRLEQLAAAMHAPVQFLGKVSDADLPDLYAASDVFVMLCRDRWFGLEQEGFGIVFLEAAAAGVTSVAGSSGGAAEAVVDGVTGIVIDEPRDVDAVIEAIAGLLEDDGRRARLAAAAQQRAVADFDYDRLARDLLAGLELHVPARVSG